MSYFYETEFDILAGFGPVWQFRVHEIVVHFIISILSNSKSRLLKQAKMMF